MVGDDLLQRLGGQGDRRVGLMADRDPDDEVLAGQRPDPFDDPGREAAAVLQGAAPAVVAPVRPWCPELIDQSVIGGEQLDAVEARLPATPRRLAEGLDDGFDLALAHGVGAVGVVV